MVMPSEVMMILTLRTEKPEEKLKARKTQYPQNEEEEEEKLKHDLRVNSVIKELSLLSCPKKI